LVRRNVALLAQALDHPQPVQTKHLRNYAANLAWLVVLEVAGSYAAFEKQIQAALLEIVSGVNELNNVLIQHELALPQTLPLGADASGGPIVGSASCVDKWL
jgi:hypothetical protein